MEKPNKGYKAIFALIKAKEHLTGLWYLFPDLPSPIALPKTFSYAYNIFWVERGWKETKMCEIKKESP